MSMEISTIRSVNEKLGDVAQSVDTNGDNEINHLELPELISKARVNGCSPEDVYFCATRIKGIENKDCYKLEDEIQALQEKDNQLKDDEESYRRIGKFKNSGRLFLLAGAITGGLTIGKKMKGEPKGLSIVLGSLLGVIGGGIIANICGAFDQDGYKYSNKADDIARERSILSSRINEKCKQALEYYEQNNGYGYSF